MRYKIVLYASDEGFAVSCPALPGCWSQGETEEEAISNIQDAIHDYLAVVDDMMTDDSARGGTVREVEVAA